jgi:hypothetical protein
MAGVIIIEYLIFVFMVLASVVIAHGGLRLVDLLDAYVSTEKHQPDRDSPAGVARHAAQIDPVITLPEE